MSEMNSAPSLLGIRFWAQWRPLGVTPAYEVFVYVGYIPQIGVHVFRGYQDHKKILNKSIAQLNINGFKPFCLDMRAIENDPVVKGLA